jgi:hypothetical protein
METRIIKVSFIDGRVYQVFCANSTQIKKMYGWYYSNKEKVKSFEFILSGIHNVKDFLTINQ